jgi:hypothetical protein
MRMNITRRVRGLPNHGGWTKVGSPEWLKEFFPDIEASDAEKEQLWQGGTMTAAACQRLPNRRDNTSFSFRWNGMAFTATFSRFDDGRLAEIFLTNGKADTDADTAARDSAVVASLALQHGADLEDASWCPAA